MDNEYSEFKRYSRINLGEEECCLAKPYAGEGKLNVGAWIQAGAAKDGRPKQGDMIAMYEQTGKAQFLVEASFWKESGYKIVDET